MAIEIVTKAAYDTLHQEILKERTNRQLSELAHSDALDEIARLKSVIARFEKTNNLVEVPYREETWCYHHGSSDHSWRDCTDPEYGAGH